MRLQIACFATALIATSASAQVTSVTAKATVTRTFRPDVVGVPIVRTVDGTTLSGVDDGLVFGSGSTFQSTSRLDPDAIYFKNSNAVAGQRVTVDSYTVVDIAFRNGELTPVRPIIESTILPAGLGLYVGPNCLTNVALCGPGARMAQPRAFDFFGPGVPGSNEIAGASFDFLIRSGSTVLYQLTGSLDYVRDPDTGVQSLITDLDAASRALIDFGKSSPDGSDKEFGFQWQATPVTVLFPATYLLDPGGVGSLTYETRVVSYSFATCTTLLTGVCLNSYSAFGDPLGKGSSQPSFSASAPEIVGFAESDDPLVFEEFRFAYPTFEKGTLSYQPLLGSPAIPEPGTWALLLAGFGLVGMARRRSKATV